MGGTARGSWRIATSRISAGTSAVSALEHTSLAIGTFGRNRDFVVEERRQCAAPLARRPPRWDAMMEATRPPAQPSRGALKTPMGQGISEILTFAVGVAISPVAIVAVILMLFSQRARTNGSAFPLGWATAESVVLELDDIQSGALHAGQLRPEF